MIKNGKWRREEVHEYTFQITSLHLKIRYFRWLSKIFKHSEMWRFIWIKRLMSGFFLSSSSAVFCVIHLHVVCNVDVTESGGFYDWLIFHGLCHNLKKEVIVENQLLTAASLRALINWMILWSDTYDYSQDMTSAMWWMGIFLQGDCP